MNKLHAKMLSPEFLGELESERTYSDNLYTRTRRVKLEKGESCLIRVLPVAMGRSGSYTARIAQHWMNKKPVVCPRFTHPDFGGDPKAHCAACEVTDEAYDQSATDDDRQFAKDASVKVKWQAWCLVFERDNGRKVEVMQPPEVWHPHEFSMSKTSFDELSAMVQRSARAKGNPLGILDLEQGCDLWVTRAANNNYRLDKADSGPTPIADVDDKFPALVEQIFAECKAPSVHVATPEALESFALKFSEAMAALAGRGHSRAPRGRGDDDGGPRSRRDEGGTRPRGEDDGGEDPRRSSRSAAPEPQAEAPARSARRQVDEGDPEPTPRRRAATSEQAEAPARSTRRSAAPPMDDSNPELAPVPRRDPRQPTADANGDEAPASRASRPGLSRLSSDETAPPSRVATSMPRRIAEQPEDPDDTAPEEARDPVPAASSELVSDDDAPPARTAGGSPLASALRRTIGVMARKGV